MEKKQSEDKAKGNYDSLNVNIKPVPGLIWCVGGDSHESRDD